MQLLVCSLYTLSVSCHSNLHGIGYRPSSLFTKIQGHVSTIQDCFCLKKGLDLKSKIGLFLHHILENPIEKWLTKF